MNGLPAIPNKEELDKALFYLNKAMNHYALTYMHIEEFAPAHRDLCEAYHKIKALGAELYERDGGFVLQSEL